MPVHRISSVTEWSTVDDARCNTFNLRKPQLFVCLCDCVFKLARSLLASRRTHTHKIPFILYFSTDWFSFSNQSTNANKSTFAQTKTNTKPPQCECECVRLEFKSKSFSTELSWLVRTVYLSMIRSLYVFWDLWMNVVDGAVSSQRLNWKIFCVLLSDVLSFLYARARVYRNE